MSYYRRVDLRMWGDSRFSSLSKMEPSAQSLWIYLLTGPHHEGLPGLFRVGRAALAESLGWEQEDLDRCFRELQTAGMAEADWSRRTIYLPNALKYQPPANPNVVKGWECLFDAVPECELREAWRTQFIELLQESEKADWADGTLFINGIDNSTENGLVNGIGNRKRKRKRKRKRQSQRKRHSEKNEEVVVAAEPATTSSRSSIENSRAAWQAEYELWVAELERRGLEEGNQLDYVGAVISGWEAAAEGYYDATSGSLTAKRKLSVARYLQRFSADVQLSALETYADRYGDKPESYIRGIARGKSRLSPKEFSTAHDRHRATMRGRGIYDEVLAARATQTEEITR